MFIYYYYLLCACYYMPLELDFYADSNAIIHFLIAPELTEIWYILTCITQLGLVITFIFLFLACLYITLEWEFHAESNAINHLSIRVELTELWSFLCLPSAYGNVYFLFFIFFMCMFLYAIGITFLRWFQCNNSFSNCTKIDWDMTHTNQYYDY